VSSEQGDRQPFLINRRWLAAEHRSETTDELAARVQADLAASIKDIVDHDLPRPALFAYPFSAETNPTNDPAAPARTAAIVARSFRVAMTNVAPDRLVSQRDRARRSLPRLEVFSTTTVADLATRIAAAGPTAPGPTDPLARPQDWTDSGGEPLAKAATGDVDQGSELADHVRFGPEPSLTLTPPEDGYLIAHHASGRSPDWSGYRVATAIAGLGTAGGGPTGSLFALLGSDREVQVAVSSSYVRIEIGPDGTERSVALERRLAASDQHRVRIDVEASALVVVVDGDELATIPTDGNPTGGIAVAASDGPVRFADAQLEDMSDR
jgi:hypothetical protein